MAGQITKGPLLAGIGALMLVISYVLSASRLLPNFLSQQQTQQKNQHQGVVGNYNALVLHEAGHWEHQYSPLPNNNESDSLDELHKTYLNTEIDWLRGKNLPKEKWNQCGENNGDGEMYVSDLGNQCGMCGRPEFQPSLSQWVSENKAIGSISSGSPTHDILSPTLRLMMRLAKANSTVCLAGDSIDFQFYDALKNNLLRQRKLQRLINISIDVKKVAANYTNDTGVPEYMGWMAMRHVLESTVYLTYDADNSTTYSSTIRYLQMYGWSPWVTSFMDDCNVVIMNLGLHYEPHTKDMRGTHWYEPKLVDDWRGAITYLVDFVSSQKDRKAVWRLVLLYIVSLSLHV
mmetsp:Transcript_25055/g.52417  ORF Transcript_25055/g.52417 Transcript_25055/m.52417 type:complete len:346 (-) Transcript_25055:15-1052(-)